jgi:hypothetical protein
MQGLLARLASGIALSRLLSALPNRLQAQLTALLLTIGLTVVLALLAGGLLVAALVGGYFTLMHQGMGTPEAITLIVGITLLLILALGLCIRHTSSKALAVFSTASADPITRFVSPIAEAFMQGMREAEKP